jgi:hypothetical protein
MKFLLNSFFGIIFICSLHACKQTAPESFSENASTAAISQQNNSALIEAFKNKKSDIFVEGSGVVKKLLADDNKGSRHQKFLVTISESQTLLFAHNIDLAPRVENLQIGDTVTFKGEYVYNPKGGVMHWTHHNPEGGSKAGWISHNGKVYE